MTCSIAINIFFYAYCNWKHLRFTVTVADFSTYFVHNIIIYKFLNGQILYNPLQLTTLICTVVKNCSLSTIPIHNFCMHYWIVQLKWKIVCNSGICSFFKCYDNIGTIAINYFCMPYFNSQLLYASLLFTQACGKRKHIVNLKL